MAVSREHQSQSTLVAIQSCQHQNNTAHHFQVGNIIAAQKSSVTFYITFSTVTSLSVHHSVIVYNSFETLFLKAQWLLHNLVHRWITSLTK